MGTPDFVTFDVFDRPPGGRLVWPIRTRRRLAPGIDGLRWSRVNWANDATHRLAANLVPGGVALVCAWESPEAARAAFAGPLRATIDGPDRFSLDGEVARVKRDNPGDSWHGWHPRTDGVNPVEADEPMVAIVHGILRRGQLGSFMAHNVDAASRARHHVGHRGSMDVSSHLPLEQTSISLWKSYGLARDFAYKPGGHAEALKHALKDKTHRVGLFLQVRPLASSGSLGIGSRAFPDLPLADRGLLTTISASGRRRSITR